MSFARFREYRPARRGGEKNGGPAEKKETDTEASVLPYKSQLTFHLNANRLTPRQFHTFLKMWLLMSGPVNDE